MIRTALVFSNTAIDLVQVDFDAKKLTVAKSQALPDEAISRGQIQDGKAVITALTELFNQTPKHPKGLILVIPEDAVISKSLILPKLKKQEIDEAVRFAAEEYLPFKLEDAVLDWKILQMDDQSHILFQAVQRNIVHSYIDLISQLDLEVDVVETPALAMVQLCDCGSVCRILIHVGQKDAILTLVKGCEVVATSVVNHSTKLAESISRTILHMMTYYRDFSVSALLVGGVGLSQNVVKQLSTLRVPVNGFNLPITAAPVVANTYLLGISAAIRDITPPSDQQTINLLPADVVSKHTSRSFINLFNYIVWLLAVGSLLIVAALGATWFWLQKEEQGIIAQKQSITPANSKTIELTNQVNTLSSLVIALVPNDQFPLELINSINALQKTGIKIAQINMKLTEKKGDVIGLADNRNSLLDFKQSLEQVSGVGTVALPASSFVEETKIPFQINFSLKESDTSKK